jgi:outer membrane protein TolC
MRKIILFFLISSIAIAQPLTLDECYKLAYNHSPLTKNGLNYKLIKDKKILNADAGYYPDFNISAQAKYQSDVLQLPIKLPTISIPEIPKENYQVVLNINQVVWDGYAISSQREIAEKQFDLDNSNIEIELYKLRERINLAYFGIISLNSRMNLMVVTISDLNEKLKDLDSKIKNGIAMQSNADFLKSERIKLEATIFEISSNINSFRTMLSKLIGKEITAAQEIVLEDYPSVPEYNISNRKEFNAFKSSKDMINSSKNLIDAKYSPKVFAFAQAGYGKPGLNMFDPDFAPFWIVGLKASWNPWSWGNQDREKEIIDVQGELVKIQEENFKQNMEILSINDKNEIEKANNNLIMDDQIILLKRAILKTSEAKFDGGVMSAVDYFNDLTALRQAEMNKEIHKIDLVKYINSYKTTLGVK